MKRIRKGDTVLVRLQVRAKVLKVYKDGSVEVEIPKAKDVVFPWHVSTLEIMSPANGLPITR